MKKVVVDESKCIGCGACVGIASKTFEFNDEGLSSVIDDTVTPEAEDAANSCPVDAIAITDNEE